MCRNYTAHMSSTQGVRAGLVQVQCPPIFSTDLHILSCQTLEGVVLLCLQEPSRRWQPPVGRPLPHDAQQLKRQLRQLQPRKVAIWLSPLGIDYHDAPLRRIVEAWIEVRPRPVEMAQRVGHQGVSVLAPSCVPAPPAGCSAYTSSVARAAAPGRGQRR
jgi:hypothetical protein